MPAMYTSCLWASHRIVSELESLVRLLLSPSLFSKIGRMSITREWTGRLPDAHFSMRALNTYAHFHVLFECLPNVQSVSAACISEDIRA